jgi:hypothetical protein
MKAKIRMLSTLNYWRFSQFIVQLKGLKSKKKKKSGSGKKCALSSSKVLAALKKQTVNKQSQRKIISWIGAKDQSSLHHYQKVFNKDGSPPQSQKNHSTSIIRHQN